MDKGGDSKNPDTWICHPWPTPAPLPAQISLKVQLKFHIFHNDLEHSKSSPNVFHRFLKTETLRETTYNETNSTMAN